MTDKKISDEQRLQLGLDFYKQFASDMEEAMQASQKTFDQAILTLSSGAVALLLTFAQSRGTDLSERVLLFISIGFFLIALSMTLISFLFVPSAIRNQLERAYRYYVNSDETNFNQPSCSENVIKVMNIGAASFFFLGIVMGVLFVALNVKGI